MRQTRRRLCVNLALTFTLVGGDAAAGAVLFEDDFDTFALNTTWAAHGAGLPQINLGVVQVNPSLGVLELHSGGGGSGFRGVQTVAPVSLAGLSNISIDVRLRPLNQGVDGTRSAAELALLGQSGAIVRSFASNNVGPDPDSTHDWADFYEDSAGTLATSGPATHCGFGGCDSFRRYILTIDDLGTTLEVRNEDGSLHGFAVEHSDITIADLGSEFSIALRQDTTVGSDDVLGWFDSIVVTTDAQVAPGPLLSAPYSQLAGGPWADRHLPGQTNFTLVSYGNPTGLATLQQYIAMLQSRGLAGGINHGSAPRPWVQPEYQYIQSLGWPMTVIAGAADFQVDGGTVLDPAYLPTLQILDSPGIKAPFHFGEWGYYFHELSSSAAYFASVYPGVDPSTYAHLMKAPGSKGYNAPPVDRIDAHDQVQSYYTNRNSDWDDRLESVTGHSHYEFYAAGWGSPTVGLEIGENIRFTQSKFAFARGASREWELPWSSQVSPWFHGSLTTAGPLTGGPGTARGQDAGHSFSFYRRAWLHSWFAGAASLEPEAGQQNLFENGAPVWDLTPLGQLAVDTFAVMQTHDRGIAYMPVAIVLDRYAGYNAFQGKPWGVFDKTDGDQKSYDLFQHQLFPGSANSNDPGAANPEAPYLVATPYGEMFDVLSSTVAADKLAAYPDILLAGDHVFDASFVDALEGALLSGSRLQLQQAHVDTLAAATFARLQAAGELTVLSEWVNPATGRPAAISNPMLGLLNERHMPVEVTGDPVQYQVNRNEEGWVVELVNNAGIVKVPHLPAVVDPNAIATVSLQPRVGVVRAYDWLSGESFPPGGAPWDVIVQPGDTRFIQLALVSDSGCGIRVEGRDPTLIHFLPDLTPLSFNIVTGFLSDLRLDQDFVRGTCLGVYSANPATDYLPDPPVGDGHYYLARGLNRCVEHGYGDSSRVPDPRDGLDAADPCP